MQVPKGYYAILFEELESKTIGVIFPEHPGVVTFGHDWEEAKEMASEALAAVLESDFDKVNFNLPPAKKPRKKKGEKVVFIRVEPNIRMAYQLRIWRKQVKLTQKQMAQRLDISYQAYQRMERPGKSNLTIETLDKIANSLNAELVIDMKLPIKKSA